MGLGYRRVPAGPVRPAAPCRGSAEPIGQACRVWLLDRGGGDGRTAPLTPCRSRLLYGPGRNGRRPGASGKPGALALDPLLESTDLVFPRIRHADVVNSVEEAVLGEFADCKMIDLLVGAGDGLLLEVH